MPVGGLIALRVAARFVFLVTRSPRARGAYLRLDDWVERDKAAELSTQFWDLERRQAAVQRNAAVEARRRRRRLHEAD